VGVTVSAELDLMPDWVAQGLSCPPWESDEVPEIPAWLLDAPVRDEEPRCDCGCACLTESPAVVPAAEIEEPVRWAVPGLWDDDTPPPVTVGPGVVALQDAVAGLERVDPRLLPGRQALLEAEAVQKVVQRLRVHSLGRLHDVHDRGLYREDGYRSTTAWLRGVAPDAAAKDVTLAKRLPDLPFVQQALHDGTVSITAAGKVAGEMVKMRPSLDRPDGLIDGLPGEEVVAAVVDDTVDVIARDRFGLCADDPAQAATLTELEQRTEAIHAGGGSQHDRVEQACVLLSEQLTVRALPAALEDVVLAVVPSLLEERDKAAQDTRALPLSPNDDGTWQVEGTLTPECGERLFTALSAEARRDPANPLDTAARARQRAADADTAGRDPWADPHLPAWEQRALREQTELLPDAEELVPRSRSKRLHDAFGRLLERYLTEGLGGVHGKVPVQVAVTMTHRLVEGQPGALPGKGSSGRPLARSLLRRWWCDSHVTTLLMSDGWVPLGVVHTLRTLTGRERTASQVQFDHRCAGDGCCSGQPDPLIVLVPHHVRRHATFGRTSLEETLLVCERLHQDLHLGKRTVRLRDGRLVDENGFVTEAE